MTLFEAALIAVGAWIVLLVVARVINEPWRRLEPYRHVSQHGWGGEKDVHGGGRPRT